MLFTDMNRVPYSATPPSDEDIGRAELRPRQDKIDLHRDTSPVHLLYLLIQIVFVTVLRHLVMRILDVPSYDPDKIKSTCIVTLHQFMRYFRDEGGLQNVDAVASERK